MDENSPNFKLLIVDDIAKNIQLVGNILKDQNYDIYFANNGNDALEQIRNINFDLILLDIMMPEMDGFDVCRKLKDNDATKEIPVIFLTAKTDIESISKGFELGGIDYVIKPFNKEELIARVRIHLLLRHSQKQLEEKNRQLNDLNATKDKFFSIVAHDLKNPFNTLIGFTEMLVKKLVTMNQQEIDEMHEVIYNAALRGYTLLENLLEWSRTQTGKIKCNPERVSIYDMINDNILLHKANAKEKNIELYSKVEGGIYVLADAYMIKTVVRNLISNAIKFTKKGGVTVNADIVDKMVNVRIMDTGIGIPEDYIDKLFRIDVNYSTKGTSGETGTGLGLILCKEFVEKNKGEIWVNSEPGKGSEFGFSLPVYN